VARVTANYVFDTPAGQRTLAELFAGRRQLMVQHFMLGPGWEQGCPSCSFMADHADGMNIHLPHRDIRFVAIESAEAAAQAEAAPAARTAEPRPPRPGCAAPSNRAPAGCAFAAPSWRPAHLSTEYFRIHRDTSVTSRSSSG
jgi:hypothetical protein